MGKNTNLSIGWLEKNGRCTSSVLCALDLWTVAESGEKGVITEDCEKGEMINWL